MRPAIVYSDAPVTLLGGGDFRRQDLSDSLSAAPMLIAADGGADVALAQGIAPDWVIGDMDSITNAAKLRIPAERQHRIAEQDSTDFDKAVRSIDAPLIIGVGFLGGRLDHQMAVLNGLVRRPDTACILIGAQEIVFHVPPTLSLDLESGDVVSLFPLAPVTARSTGLEWPLDGVPFAPDGRVGTSNRAIGPVRFWTDQPGMLAMVPRSRLDAVLAAFKSR